MTLTLAAVALVGDVYEVYMSVFKNLYYKIKGWFTITRKDETVLTPVNPENPNFSILKIMKARFLTLFLALFISCAVAQEYAFKVLANKGANEVKSGSEWAPIKTGASLKNDDELKLSPNSYMGLVHATGKPLELKHTWKL